MKVVVKLIITREEVEQYRKSWKEFNEGDISDAEIKDKFLDDFWADKQEYLSSADFRCNIAEPLSIFESFPFKNSKFNANEENE